MEQGSILEDINLSDVQKKALALGGLKSLNGGLVSAEPSFIQTSRARTKSP